MSPTNDQVDPSDTPASRRTETQREWRLGGVIFFGILALVLLWAAGMILWPFLSALIVAAIIVTLTYPRYLHVRERLHGRSSAAALVMLLGITLLLILPAFIVGMLVVQQAGVLIQHMRSGEAQIIVQRLDLADRLAWLKRFFPNFDPSTVSAQKLILPIVQRVPSWAAEHGGAILGSVAGLVMGVFFVVLAAYFFYVEGEAIVAELRILSPLPTSYDRRFAEQFKDVIDATFRGHILTAFAQGIVTMIGLVIARVPGAFFWGAVATIISLLPMVGAAVVWVPAAIYLYIIESMNHTSYWPAIFLTAWGLTVVPVIEHVIRPWAMRGKSQLPAIPLLFAVLGGMEAFGIIGMVIGPLVFSLLTSIIDIYKQQFRIPTPDTDVA